jgi:uncharacterized protein
MPPASPDCSCKDGPAASYVTAADELAFPGYDGNGISKSWGNGLVNANVGLPFIDMHGSGGGSGSTLKPGLSREDPRLGASVGGTTEGAVTARAIFPNCPPYIAKLALREPSPSVSHPGAELIEPAWKGFAACKDVVHPRQPTAKG